MKRQFPPTCIYAPVERIRLALREALALRFETSKPLYDAIPVLLHEEVAIIGPAIGAAAAGLICHAVSEKTLILASCAGSLSPADCDIGDIVLPKAAISDEGVSKRYGVFKSISRTPIQESLESCIVESDSPRNLKKAGIISTDTPFLEDATWVENARAHGADAVDMEFSVLSTLSSTMNFQLGAVFVITDRVVEPKLRGFSSPEVKGAIETMTRAIKTLVLGS